jgi:hypothetical protein
VEFRDVNSNSNKSTSRITILILTPLESLVISLENLKDPKIESISTLKGITRTRVRTLKAFFPLIDKDTTLLLTKGNNHTLSKGKESNST